METEALQIIIWAFIGGIMACMPTIYKILFYKNNYELDYHPKSEIKRLAPNKKHRKICLHEFSLIGYSLNSNIKLMKYNISFICAKKTFRFNILRKENIESEYLLFQLMDKFLRSLMPIDGKTDEWYLGALGILKGVAYRFYSFKGEFERLCTLPHILNFILLAKPEELIKFLEGDNMSKSLAGAFIGAKGSERTLSSYLSTLNNYITNLATNKNICYVLTGDDFIFNLVDPEDPNLSLFCSDGIASSQSIFVPIAEMLKFISELNSNTSIIFPSYSFDIQTNFEVNIDDNYDKIIQDLTILFERECGTEY